MEYKIKQYWKPIVSVIFYIAVATVAAKFVPHNSMEDIYDGNILLQIRHDFLQMLLIAPFAFAYCRGGQPRAQEAGITKKFFSAIVCVASALVAVGVALRHASFYTLYAFFYWWWHAAKNLFSEGIYSKGFMRKALFVWLCWSAAFYMAWRMAFFLLPFFAPHGGRFSAISAGESLARHFMHFYSNKPARLPCRFWFTGHWTFADIFSEG